MQYTRVDVAGTVLEIRDCAGPPPDLPQKGWRWLAAPDQKPVFDPARQVLVDQGVVVAPDGRSAARVFAAAPLPAPAATVADRLAKLEAAVFKP